MLGALARPALSTLPMRPLLAILLLCSAAGVQAVDDFVPHADGRPGGCYRSAKGQLYGCVEAPRRATRNAGQEAEQQADDDDEDAAEPLSVEEATRAEVLALRAELELLKAQQAEDDARRAQADALRSEAERAAQAAEQADVDAAMAAYNAIEAAKDSVRLRELDRKTEGCRRTLEQRGYTVVGPGACRAPDASYVNCPEC